MLIFLLLIDSAESDETERLNDNGSEDISYKFLQNNVVEGKTKTHGKIGNVYAINIMMSILKYNSHFSFMLIGACFIFLNI